MSFIGCLKASIGVACASLFALSITPFAIAAPLAPVQTATLGMIGQSSVELIRNDRDRYAYRRDRDDDYGYDDDDDAYDYDVDAPTTYVRRRGRDVDVDAPFTSVRRSRDGVHVRAPFVDLWVPRY